MNNENKVGRKPKKRIKIAIDAGSLSDPNTNSQAGVFTLTLNLIEELLRLDKRNQYLIFGFSNIVKAALPKRDRRISHVVLPKYAFKSVWLPLAFKIYKPDVFLAMSQAMPSTAPKTLGFIYDLAFLKFPKMYKNAAELKNNTEQLMKNAHHIITISKSSALDIKRVYAFDEKRLSILYPGVNRIFKSDGSKYIDTSPYFLYVGALKKTKNIITLISAFAEFLHMVNKPFKLILVGSTQKLDPEIKSHIQKLSLHDMVILKDFAKTEDLPKYYRGAFSFVSVALAEGFGLPILEAMRCGVPVIAAQNSSMPEIVGNAGILVDGQSTQSIATGMLLLSNNESIRKKYAEHGLKQSKQFSWTKFAHGVLELVYEIIN